MIIVYLMELFSVMFYFCMIFKVESIIYIIIVLLINLIISMFVEKTNNIVKYFVITDFFTLFMLIIVLVSEYMNYQYLGIMICFGFFQFFMWMVKTVENCYLNWFVFMISYSKWVFSMYVMNMSNINQTLWIIILLMSVIMLLFINFNTLEFIIISSSIFFCWLMMIWKYFDMNNCWVIFVYLLMFIGINQFFIWMFNKKSLVIISIVILFWGLCLLQIIWFVIKLNVLFDMIMNNVLNSLLLLISSIISIICYIRIIYFSINMKDYYLWFPMLLIGLHMFMMYYVFIMFS